MSIQVVTNTEAGKCPKCGHLNDLTPKDVSIGFQDDKIFVDYTCFHSGCDFEWTDWYTFENSTYIDTVLGDND